MEEIAVLTDKLKAAKTAFSKVLKKSLMYNREKEGELAAPGAKQLEELGDRTRERLRNSVPLEFTAEKFVLQHTYKSRTKKSAEAFASTFFTNPNDVQYVEFTKKKDPLLRYYDQCPRYDQDVKESPASLEEHDAFLQSSLMLNATERVSQIAGVKLTPEEMLAAYSACAFDIALSKTSKEWCLLFDRTTIQVAQFADDLETFYQESAGFAINYEISAVLLRDIVQTMKATISGKSQVVGNFRFVHGETILPLLTLLGYVERTALRADWTTQQIESRVFRTSKLVPFMGNIEFRLYKKNASTTDEYFVQVRINESILPIPGCSDKIFCPLTTYEQMWEYYLKNYDFTKSCSV